MALKGQNVKDRTGEKHITNEGYEIEILKYTNWYECTIKFNDEINTIVENARYEHILKGQISNKNHKSIFNIGFIGYGKYNNKNFKKAYSTWYKMFGRCYDEKVQNRQPTYKGVTVCEEWHCYQNFAKWFENNYVEGWHLDKDILVKGNKIYSPQTSCFVPSEINTLFVKANSSRGIYPIGVSKQDNKYYRVCFTKNNEYCYLGLFTTVKEAFRVYKIAKETYIQKVADKWKNLIDFRVYQALYNYKIEIND